VWDCAPPSGEYGSIATTIEVVFRIDLVLRQQMQGGGLVTGRAWDEAPNMWRVETLNAPDWLHPRSRESLCSR
jgi:hypothetical protein